MLTNSNGHALSRATTLLLAGLMVLSTGLFVAGATLERSSPGSGDSHASAPQVAATAPAGVEAPEGSEAREAQERQEATAAAAPDSAQGAEGTEAHEQAEQNGVFGISLESPGVIAGVLMATLLLIAGLLVFGYRVLPLVFIVALVAMVLDGREVVYQLGQAHYTVALLAIGVALSRLATVIVSGRAWRAGQRHAAPAPVR